MTAIDRLTVKRIAFGIRFNNQFGIEDALGEIVDEVLNSPKFGPERFDSTALATGRRQLIGSASDEIVSFTRADAIFDSRSKDLAIDGLPAMADDFVEHIWAAVCKRAPRVPSINRYGCLIGFELPESWNPIQTFLATDPEDTSELDFRFSRRFVIQEALAMRDVSDYGNATFQTQTREGKTAAFIDFQHYFIPALASEKARNEHRYTRFVDKALDYYRGAGWDFLKSKLERLPRAA